MSTQFNTSMPPVARGHFNEISNADYPTWLSALLTDLDGVSWTQGIESLNKRGGFESINLDVYSFDNSRRLAIVQVRQSYKRKSSYFTRVRKDYYLVGRNENGNPFAHPVSANVRKGKAIETTEGAVLKALAEIWNCDAEDLDLIRRNGDVAFVPITSRSIPKDVVEIEGVTLLMSHTLIPSRDGRVLYSPSTKTHYVRKCAKLSHEKGQHPSAAVDSGTWRVQEGLRASIWGFTQPTRD